MLDSLLVAIQYAPLLLSSGVALIAVSPASSQAAYGMHIQLCMRCEEALLYICLHMHLLLRSSLLCFEVSSYVLISIALLLLV